MKQDMLTAPIIDAFSSKTECPLCIIKESIELGFIKSLYNEMVMDIDFNKKLGNYSFCDEHFRKLFEYPDKLGLAVILRWMIDREISEIKNRNSKASQYNNSLKGILSRIKANEKPDVKEEKPCYICSHLEHRMSKILETTISTWKNYSEFQELYKNSSGFCSTHFNILMDSAFSLLNNEAYNNFANITINLQIGNLERLGNELDWFIKKHDYRFVNEPWKTSKDSVARSIIKLK